MIGKPFSGIQRRGELPLQLKQEQPKVVAEPVEQPEDNKEQLINKILNDIKQGTDVHDAIKALKDLGIEIISRRVGRKVVCTFEFNGKQYTFNFTINNRVHSEFGQTEDPATANSQAQPTTNSNPVASDLTAATTAQTVSASTPVQYVATQASCEKEAKTYLEALKNALKTSGDQGYGDGLYVLSDDEIDTYMYLSAIVSIDITRLTEEYVGKKGVQGKFAAYLKEGLRGIVANRLKGMDASKYLYGENDGLKGQVIADLQSGKYAQGYKFSQEDAVAIFNRTAASGTSDLIWELIRQGKSVTEIKSALRSDVETKVRSFAQERANELKKNPSNAASSALNALSENEKSSSRMNRISSTIYSLEQEYLSKYNKSSKINILYNQGSEGTLLFNDPYVYTMYEDLFAHIKDVIGTDGFDEQTLKRLYQAAWMMTSGVDVAAWMLTEAGSGQMQDISDFLTNVYENFKNILSRIKEKPEYLDIFLGKSGNYDVWEESGQGYRTSDVKIDLDDTVTVYDDNSIHTENDEVDAHLQKATKQLIQYLQSIHPKMPVDAIKLLVYSSVHEAMGDIYHNIKTSPKQCSLEEVINLAYQIFEQKLLTQALTDDSLLNGNHAKEERTCSVDDSTANKYKQASGMIVNMLTDIFDENYISGLLANIQCQGFYSVEFILWGGNHLQLLDSHTQKAYNELLQAIKTKSGFKNSGLSDEEFLQIYNLAWMDVYNSIDCGEVVDLSRVLNKVIANMQKILNKINENPEYLRIIQNDNAMLHKPNFSNYVTLYYDYTDINLDYGDNNVHLSNDDSDKIYQNAIEQLRIMLKDSYVPPLSEEQFEAWFAQSQKEALYDLINNNKDVIKCTTWSAPQDQINLYDLMNFIAYKFNKIMLANIFGYENDI